MIGDRLLITNHHVIVARAPLEPPPSTTDFDLQAQNTHALFDYHDDDSTGVSVAATSWAVHDQELDYAVLRLDPAASGRQPLPLRPNALTRAPDTPLRERVNVLQHPLGGPMRLGFRNNFVVTGSADRLSYLTDTAGGSSGSPICDDLWFVAGLHRGWGPIKGDPVSVWGTEIRQENYATPIGRILADIAAKDPALRAEIGSP
jgi:V8-like Glu-specific endopeptidase